MGVGRNANADPVQMPQSVASDQGLHCFAGENFYKNAFNMQTSDTLKLEIVFLK